MEKIEYRVLIKFLHLKGNTSTQIKAELDAVYEDPAPSFATVKRWVAEFKRGRTSVTDDERLRRPTTATTTDNIEEIHALLERFKQNESDFLRPLITVDEPAPKNAKTVLSAEKLKAEIEKKRPHLRVDKGTKKFQTEYIMGHQRVVPQLVPCMITESIVKCNAKSMVDHLVNVDEDVDVDDVVFENIGNIEDIAEFIKNVDEEQFANIRDEVFEVLEEMEVDFAEIMDQDSSDEESVLSDDTGFASDASEYETDIEEKFIPAAEIRALNDRTKYCMIQSY
ncbi:hypothetical protein ALC57_14173 [Trachymyrmex cornetzi]|uniref:Mos1 transposase HTH domain-containing protein n=1 Tax=Trachymyrmex cornetzi TaxID=471704 RepID=A0A151IYN9_9HYME|nr:hypothetical protein ALC57_14173 [Trachymyrmex cornetzi]